MGWDISEYSHLFPKICTLWYSWHLCIESESCYDIVIFPGFFDDGISLTSFVFFWWIFRRYYVDGCYLIQILIRLFSHIQRCSSEEFVPFYSPATGLWEFFFIIFFNGNNFILICIFLIVTANRMFLSFFGNYICVWIVWKKWFW